MASPLRTWQEQALDPLAAWQGGPFLISAVPGAGKRPALRHAQRQGEATERQPRTAAEPADAAAFVPLGADVSPQMTLFGGPAPAPAPAAAAAVALPPAAPSTFERRALLREERHRLLSDLRRSGGGTHQEINAWLNRALGLRRVEHATLNQLEPSVELLVDRLAGKRPSARPAERRPAPRRPGSSPGPRAISFAT